MNARARTVAIAAIVLGCSATNDHSGSAGSASSEAGAQAASPWKCDCWTTDSTDSTERLTDWSGFCSASDPIKAEVKLLCGNTFWQDMPSKCGCKSCQRANEKCTSENSVFGDPTEKPAHDASTPEPQRWICGCTERGQIGGIWTDWHDTKTVPEGGFGACSGDDPRSAVERQCESRLDAGILECKCTCSAKGPCNRDAGA